MSVYVRNFTINAHQDFSENLELSKLGDIPTNLTGFTGLSQMRKHAESSGSYNFAVGITSAAAGELTLSMGSTMTSDIKPGRHVYDLMLIRPNGDKTIVLEGSITVRPGISTNCP